MAPTARELGVPPACGGNAAANVDQVRRGHVALGARVVERAAGRLLDTLIGMPRRVRHVFMTVGVLVSLVGLVLSACTVNPPPAPQSTDTPHNSPPPPPRVTQIIMGIDSIGAGFNPHLLSDLSPVNAAISALVLPSAFRPVPDPNSPTGSRWEMDPTLLVSAEVTNQNPFTVTYKIRPEAQWTDNAPIAADDFWYLWRQMVSQPGVVDPAGYDLITGVQSLEGGKQAVVTFAQPYPAWKELFSNILPAHIVKDVPGGFAAGLARALPVTGGQFRVESIDPQRDEILIARNDRYWGPPAKPALILFRRAGAPAALADSVRNGDTQVAQVHGGSAAFAQLSAIPDVRTARIVTPRVMQLTLRANEPKLSDTQVRKAILGLLDVDLLAAVGAGSDNTVTLDQAQIRSPSDPGYEPTAPPAMTTPAALALLEESGYKIESNTVGVTGADAGEHRAAGSHPRPDQQRRSTAVARHRSGGERPDLGRGGQHGRRPVAQRRHRRDRAGAGPSDAVPRRAEQQPGGRDRRLASGRRKSGDATGLALRLPRAAVDAGLDLQRGDDHVPPALPGHAARRPGHHRRDVRPRASRPPDPGALVQAPSNLTGICDRSIQSNIDAALNGTKNINDVITAVEPRLWNMSTVLPILQDTTIVAAGPSVQNVSLSGAVPVGIVGDAGQWIKTGP